MFGRKSEIEKIREAIAEFDEITRAIGDELQAIAARNAAREQSRNQAAAGGAAGSPEPEADAGAERRVDALRRRLLVLGENLVGHCARLYGGLAETEANLRNQFARDWAAACEPIAQLLGRYALLHDVAHVLPPVLPTAGPAPELADASPEHAAVRQISSAIGGLSSDWRLTPLLGDVFAPPDDALAVVQGLKDRVSAAEDAYRQQRRAARDRAAAEAAG